MSNSINHWLSGFTLAVTCTTISATAILAQTVDSNICYFVSESGEVINLESWCGSGSDNAGSSSVSETAAPETRSRSTSPDEDTGPRTHFSRYGTVTDADGNPQRVRNLRVQEREDGGVTVEYQTPVSPEEVFDDNNLMNSTGREPDESDSDN